MGIGTIRFAICDDDVIYSEKFMNIIRKEYLSKHPYLDVDIVKYSSGDEIVKNYLKDNIDVVFMDIEIGDENGFDVAKKLVKMVDDLGIVYITNHDFYVTEAFVCRPLGFIRKDKVENDIKRTIFSIDEFLVEKTREFLFQDGDKILPIKLDKVRFVEVYDHDFIVALRDSVLKIRDKMKRVESGLEENGFIKISRSRMINPKYIKLIDKDECVLNNDDRFRISRKRIVHTKNAFVKYKIKY